MNKREYCESWGAGWKLYQSIESEKQRSAWDKGVTKYALELVEQLSEQTNVG